MVKEPQISVLYLMCSTMHINGFYEFTNIGNIFQNINMITKITVFFLVTSKLYKLSSKLFLNLDYFRMIYFLIFDYYSYFAKFNILFIFLCFSLISHHINKQHYVDRRSFSFSSSIKKVNTQQAKICRILNV